MQAMLCVSSALLLCSVAMAEPQVSVEAGSESNDLVLRGAIAGSIFEHLAGPEIQTSTYPEFEVRQGQGIVCVHNPLSELHQCRETVTGRGEVSANFPARPELKQNPNWIILNLSGSALETIFTSMGDYGDVRELSTKVQYIKKGNGLSCTKTVSIATQKETFACGQYLSSDGMPIGTGTDPLIGSGTHPVMTANGDLP